jgi:hypothetical protein
MGVDSAGALTFETMARAYWDMKDVDGAKAASIPVEPR